MSEVSGCRSEHLQTRLTQHLRIAGIAGMASSHEGGRLRAKLGGAGR